MHQFLSETLHSCDLGILSKISLGVTKIFVFDVMRRNKMTIIVNDRPQVSVSFPVLDIHSDISILHRTSSNLERP